MRTRQRTGLPVRIATAALAALALLAAMAFQAPATAQSPASLEILSVHHDPQGSLVVALRASGARDADISNLTIFVDDIPLRAGPDGRAAADDLALVLAMDTSGSMAGEPMQAAGQAARALLSRLAPDDRVSVVTFATVPSVRTALTADRGLLDSIMDSLVADGWTALYDAVGLGVAELEGAPEERRVMLLLSDGQDFGGVSTAGREGSIDRARESGVTVYAVGLGPDYDEAYLQALAAATEGQFFPMRDESDVAALTALFTRLGGELGASDTYTLGVPPLARGAHELRIRASVDGTAVSASTTFQVSNLGLLQPEVLPASAPDRPIEVRFGALVAPAELSLEVEVAGVRFRAASPEADSVAVDPWALPPGTHQGEVVAYASGGVAYREAVTVDVPPLAPSLVVTVGEDGAVARGRVQGAAAVLVALEDGVEVARSQSGTLVLEPGRHETVVEMRGADGAVLATEHVEAALAAEASGGALAGLVLLLLLGAGGGYAGLRRLRSRRRPVAERILRPLPRIPAAVPLADTERAAGPAAPVVLGEIVVVEASGNRRRVPLTSRPLTVGSSLACDIVLGDPVVRGEHLRLTALPGNEVRVHVLPDRGAQRQAPYQEEQWLIARDGEQISLGSCALQISRTVVAGPAPGEPIPLHAEAGS